MPAFLLRELCREKGASLFAVHVNHCLRGAEADGDEAYVRELCGRLTIPLRTVSFDVKGRAAREHLPWRRRSGSAGMRPSRRKQGS